MVLFYLQPLEGNLPTSGPQWAVILLFRKIAAWSLTVVSCLFQNGGFSIFVISILADSYICPLSLLSGHVFCDNNLQIKKLSLDLDNMNRIKSPLHHITKFKN